MHGDTMEMWRTEPFQVRFHCVCVSCRVCRVCREWATTHWSIFPSLCRCTDVPGRTVLVSASTPGQGVGAGGVWCARRAASTAAAAATTSAKGGSLVGV
jgi:hypothetical protein